MPSKSDFPVLDPDSVPANTGSTYPEALKGVVQGREGRALGAALGLKNFGANLVTLAPGAASSHRHWHSHEDEFVYVLDGTLTLVMNAGEREIAAGMAAGFPAGVADGHCFVNKTDRPASFLVVGDRSPGDTCSYPDVDMHMTRGLSAAFARKDGTPY